MLMCWGLRFGRRDFNKPAPLLVGWWHTAECRCLCSSFSYELFHNVCRGGINNPHLGVRELELVIPVQVMMIIC